MNGVSEELMTLYEKLCRGSRKIPLYGLGRKAQDRELARAVAFLSPMMSLSVEGIVSASYLLSVLVLLLLTLLLSLLGISVVVAVLLSLTTSVIIYYFIANYPISIMEGYRLALSEESDLVFEQFLIVFESGGTIFDAIEMVANSQHPLLSAKFRDMIASINKGIPPEECISEFAENQPSDDLRRYLMAILSSLERKTDLLESLSGESFEADSTLRQKNMEVESRLLIVAALVTYLPIMITLAISLAGYADNLVILLIAPLFVAVNALLKSRFSRSFSAYFDRPQKTGLRTPSQGEIIAEYDEFLNFMILLGERLAMGDNLEVALPAIRDQVGHEVQRLIDPAIKSVYWSRHSIEEAMEIAAGAALGQRVSNMLGMIMDMCATSAKDAGRRISRIAARLVKRSAVVKERNSIIAAQKLKVYILSATSAIVLGLLSSLAPFLYIGQWLFQGPNGSHPIITSSDILPLVATLSIITLSSGYQNVRMVEGKRARLLALLCLLLYLTSFALSSFYMGFEMS